MKGRGWFVGATATAALGLLMAVGLYGRESSYRSSHPASDLADFLVDLALVVVIVAAAGLLLAVGALVWTRKREQAPPP